MISFKNFSIRRKITFIILVVTFVSGGVGSILDALGEYSLSKEKLVTESSMVATLVSEYCITPLDFGYQDEAVANLAKLATIPSIYNGIVFDIDGNVFAEYDRYLGVSTETIASGESYSRFEDEWLHVLRPIEYKGEKKGAIYLRVSTFEISQRLQYHLLSMVVIGLGVMVIAFLLATSLQKLISQPILTLVDLTKRISQEADYTVRGEKTTNDEIGSLYDGLNNMLEQLHLRSTENDQAGEFLRLSEEKYRLLFERSNDAVFLVNVDTGKYLDANAAAEVLTGRTKSELTSLTTADITPRGSSLRLEKLMTAGAINEDTEVEYVRPDGTIRIATLSVIPQKDNIFYGIAHDITEQKSIEIERASIEKQLQQSQKLEALGAVVGGIAHEFNNILQSMFLYSEIVREALPDDESLHKNFQHIIDDGKRARDIVKQILTFSRKSKIEMKPRAIQNIILEALLFERASLSSNITIQQSIDVNCDLVLCDKTQVHQIIINLCNNAQHAMAESGGTLTVSLSQIKAPFGKKKKKQIVLELTVTDTGKGMDTETMEKIFDPFFTTKTVGKGTGLGLSVIHGIVEMMNGEISVKSTLGQGTTFKILIPIAKTVPEYSSNIPKITVRGGGKSIMLVDDEESIRIATQQMLFRKNFSVDVAPDGRQALELFKENPEKYDVIVTDLSMPDVSGVELTKAIRKSDSTIPIILSSGNLGIEDKNEYSDIGITGFIQKPWTVLQLIKRIQELDK